jgi:phytoene synthase
MTPAQIARASGSNLAFSFFALPKNRREDIEIFYAFCREVDDIADDPVLDLHEKTRRLRMWREALDREVAGEPALAMLIRELLGRYPIPAAHFHEILTGVEMDLQPAVYEKFQDLRLYCHRVAGVVGLVSIEIFGYRNPGCRIYAEDLGLALQLTNILRDVAEDFANGGRIYLPVEDMERFGFSKEDLERGTWNENFVKLMNFQAARASSFFNKASSELPSEDAKSMLPAEMMKGIYTRLLRRMQRDRFRVFTRRYRLSRLEKIAVAASIWIRSFFRGGASAQ